MVYTNPTQSVADAQNQIAGIRGSYKASIAVTGFISTDAAWPKWAAYAVAGGVAAYYVAKMEGEIAGIMRRAGDPQGYMYSLTANTSGDYPVLAWGNRATSTTTLTAGDVWKYGETSSKSDRYSASQLKVIRAGGVKQNPLFFGNQVQIKVAEKTAIYNYFFQYGHLPPGNKIFR